MRSLEQKPAKLLSRRRNLSRCQLKVKKELTGATQTSSAQAAEINIDLYLHSLRCFERLMFSLFVKYKRSIFLPLGRFTQPCREMLSGCRIATDTILAFSPAPGKILLQYSNNTKSIGRHLRVKEAFSKEDVREP